MSNTESSFRDKWKNNPKLAFEETLREGSETFNWILNRNGFDNAQAFQLFLKNKKRILDAGCGNGRVTALIRKYADPQAEIIGIDLVAHEIARSNLGNEPRTHFYKRNLLEDLDDLGRFDFIYCQEVLHHTGDPRKAFVNLSRLLLPGSEIAIYVYKKKAPVREFVDDFIRNRIGGLSYEDALKTCSQITQLGKILSQIEGSIKIPALDALGIPQGEYSVQRFFYHFFMKCFWNDHMTFDENAVINYDWYHPQDCTRHELPEVIEWFQSERLTIVHQFEDFYGITVRGASSH